MYKMNCKWNNKVNDDHPFHKPTGTFTFNINITQPALAQSLGSSDIFLLRFTFDGTPMSGARFGGSNTDTVADLQMDAFGGVYMAGVGPTGLSFGTNLNTTSGSFLTRFITVRNQI